MAVAVSGCVHNPNNLTTMWLDSYAHPNPTLAAFRNATVSSARKYRPSH